ncbi:MAG: adaptor protein MecA [Eubacterium sp.]|nr:adaptor protein MecA [Eubacterium sp.]
MKIEKVNDNQIRCTLTKEDLADRHIKLSELAYGTDKAKDLFRDMMQQAAYEYGFDAEDIPLMIEAIPLSSENILLIITKVENPEELDTRFSQFSPADEEDSPLSDAGGAPILETAEDIIDLFKTMSAAGKTAKDTGKKPSDFVPLSETLGHKSKNPSNANVANPQPEAEVITDITKLYSFKEITEISKLARVVEGFYSGSNSLYKNPATGSYYLFLSKSTHTPEEFNKMCNILSEYAHQEKYSDAVEAFFNEHCELLIPSNALHVMAGI